MKGNYVKLKEIWKGGSQNMEKQEKKRESVEEENATAIK